MKLRPFRFAIPAILLAAAVASSEEPGGAPSRAAEPMEAVSKLDEAWWKERFERTTPLAVAQEARVLFHGDSITHLWDAHGKDVWSRSMAPLGAVNQGFSGDRVEHQLWRLRNGDLERSNARVVVLMIGTNNLGFDPLDRLEATIGAMLEEIHARMPRADVLLLGLLPRGAPDDPHRERIRELNGMLAKRTAERADPRVRFLDHGAIFLEPDGTISKGVMYDGLHLTEEGYRRWADALLPVLEGLLAEERGGPN